MSDYFIGVFDSTPPASEIIANGKCDMGAYWIDESTGRYGRYYRGSDTTVKAAYVPSGSGAYHVIFTSESPSWLSYYGTDMNDSGVFDVYSGTVFGTASGNIYWSQANLYIDPDMLNPAIPIFTTREDAVSAADNGHWNAVTKYSNGGYSSDGGGFGDYDNDGDDIDFSDEPDSPGFGTGLFTAYVPTRAELIEFSDFLWSDLFDIDTLKKIFANPFDYIFALSAIPIDVPINAASENVMLGNVNTGVSMHSARKQFVTIDCGVVMLGKYFDGYLDYSPYTDITIFLPFIGMRQLDPAEVNGNAKIWLTYRFDILSGACIAEIKAQKDSDDLLSVLYSFAGTCKVDIPVSGNSYNNIISAATSVGNGVVGMAAGAATGNIPQAIMAASNIPAAAASAAIPTVSRSGNYGSAQGFMGERTPYLIIKRPKQCLPEYQDEFKGYPSYITRVLGTCEGFTQIDSWEPEGFTCTAEELAEIDSLLKEGIFI